MLTNSSRIPAKDGSSFGRSKLTIFSLSFLFLLLATYYLLPTPAHAVCPVCAIAVGAGLGLSRYLGVDDLVSGIWVGGLILTMSFWLVDWLGKKSEKIKSSNQLIITTTAVIAMYGFTILPLQAMGITGHPFNTIRLLGISFDKLVFGSIIGSLVFLLGVGMDKIERKAKDGKILFPFQKVVFPVVSLIITSLVVYFVVLPAFRI